MEYWDREPNRETARALWGEAERFQSFQCFKDYFNGPVRAIPLRVYGDGADVFGRFAVSVMLSCLLLGNENFECYSLVAVLGGGGTLDSRFVLLSCNSIKAL